MAKMIGVAVFLSSLMILTNSMQKTVTEGPSTNVSFLCDLVGHPLYWNISGKVYELYSVPEVFMIVSDRDLALSSVDRRMNGWNLQCFTVDLVEGWIYGQIIQLTVIINEVDQSSPNDTTSTTLLKPSIQVPVLHYQKLLVGPDAITLGWLTPPDPLTLSSGTRVDISTLSDQRDLTVLQTIDVYASLDLHLLKDSTNNSNFFVRVSTLQEDGTVSVASAYFHTLVLKGANETIIHVSGNSACFELAENLRSNRSLQLIWSKDENTQCVCPPVEQLIAQCACNIDTPNNVVTISGHVFSVSNLTQEMDEGEVLLHFVSSVSSGCHGTCNLRSIVGVYRIIMTQGDRQAPTINVTLNKFCFDIPDNPIHPEVYEVNLTDSTGSLTRLSGIYNTSHCLSITSDLYPDVCGPFQLSVAAVNNVGREITQLVINTTNMAELTPCDCYRNRGKFEISSITTTPTSVDFSLHCDENLSITLATIQTDNSMVTQDAIMSCNGSASLVSSLMPSTNYTIAVILSGSTVPSCSLSTFRTSAKGIGRTASIVIACSGSLLLLVLVIAVGIVLTYYLILRHKNI